MKKFLRILIINGAIVFFNIHFADAGFCGPHDEFVKALNDKYRETTFFMGTVNGTSLVEMYRSESGTWTVLVTTPDGRSCIVAAGQDGTDVKLTVPGQKL